MLQTRPAWHALEGLWRPLRLGTGLVLLAFVALHSANHALNLVSADAAEGGRRLFQLIWRSWPGTILLYGSILVHFALTLWSLSARRTLRMPIREAAQIVLGLLVPLLLIDHVVATRVLASASGVDVTYPAIARNLWVRDPLAGLKQSVALSLAWAHGCVGVYFWLRFRKRYPLFSPYLLVVAVLLPVLALLGFVAAGRAVEAVGALAPAAVTRASDAVAAVGWVRPALYAVFWGGLGAVALLHAGRALGRRRNQVRVRYGSGAAVDVPIGSNVLEASRIGGIPHYAVCGGKGRCSTCRVQVVAGRSRLREPSPTEAATLRRIGAAPDVRLACQLRPRHPITVLPLLTPQPQARGAPDAQDSEPGREADIAVLFCDIRGFTQIAETRLPFDVVFLLNRYFAIVGHAVERSGGRLDKFIGDGAMALFTPTEAGAGDACRRALEAALRIRRDLELLSADLASELAAPLRVAIGIHSGPAIVGRMGFGDAMGVTAIGDTVNVASRLEAAAKAFDAAVVVSTDTARLSGQDLSAFPIRDIPIRGRNAPLSVHVIPQEAPAALRPPRPAQAGAEASPA